jgi:hypothetical protein
MTPSHRELDPDHIPLAFMITLRAHGTWRGIRETCKTRNWDLLALNVRSNQVHSVVAASCSSKKVRAAFEGQRYVDDERVRLLATNVEGGRYRSRTVPSGSLNVESCPRWMRALPLPTVTRAQ